MSAFLSDEPVKKVWFIFIGYKKLKVKFIPIVLVFLAAVFFIFRNQKRGNKKSESANIELMNTSTAKKVDTFSQEATVVSTPQKVLQVKVVSKKNKIDSLIKFAKSLIGTPYKYASTDPSVGFDCSGFINYVFNHFNIKVPRSSRDFRNAGKKIALGDSKPGDLILFTGTNPSERDNRSYWFDYFEQRWHLIYSFIIRKSRRSGYYRVERLLPQQVCKSRKSVF